MCKLCEDHGAMPPDEPEIEAFVRKLKEAAEFARENPTKVDGNLIGGLCESWADVVNGRGHG